MCVSRAGDKTNIVYVESGGSANVEAKGRKEKKAKTHSDSDLY